MKIVLFGQSGMLGSMVYKVLSKNKKWKIIVFNRDQLDASNTDVNQIKELIQDSDWVINAIGVIKQRLNENNQSEVENAIRVNALFPHILARAIENTDTKVIQIATDCVYSGSVGAYTETNLHDAFDVYGKTKSLGEVNSKNFYNLRCSIVGPEVNNHLSLLDWFLSQSKDVNGYINHRWNGITTLHFAKICQGIIKNPVTWPNTQHIIPDNTITKYDLLKTFAKVFNQQDITVKPVEARVAIDRTLSTDNILVNQHLWLAAGYFKKPTIKQMIVELGKYK